MNSSAPKSLLSPRWSTLFVSVAGLSVGILGYWFGGTISSSHKLASPAPTLVSGTSNAAAESSSSKNSAALRDWERRWGEIAARPNSPARIRALEALLEELARTQPERALERALAEGNWLARDRLRNAALRGWGAVAPDAAAEWANKQPLLGDRMQCVEAVLTGATERPEEAVRVGLRLCAGEAEAAGAYGHALINALVDRTGSFDAAAHFAIGATMVDRQSFLLDSAFYQWSQHDPDRAREEFGKISDPQIRSAALKGMIAGWADSNPQKLADFAQALPSGADRSQALEIALPQWAGKDPEAVWKWMNQAEPDPDFDRGIAALALLPTFHPRPELAMDLSDNITDPARRVLTKSNVFYQWAIRDPAAARKYAESTPNREQREMLLEDLASLEASQRRNR